MVYTHPRSISSNDSVNQTGKQRNSNLELYRIICMLMILAHHYVVNSGLLSSEGLLTKDYPLTGNLFLTLFGAWGKTGINYNRVFYVYQ